MIKNTNLGKINGSVFAESSLINERLPVVIFMLISEKPIAEEFYSKMPQ
jgi:hypothetical protein